MPFFLKFMLIHLEHILHYHCAPWPYCDKSFYTKSKVNDFSLFYYLRIPFGKVFLFLCCKSFCIFCHFYYIIYCFLFSLSMIKGISFRVPFTVVISITSP